MIELIKQYGEDIYKTGIYKISALYDPSMFYIGMTSRVAKYNSNSGFYFRWSRHIRDLSQNIHVNPFLQRIYNKYTINSLKFEILEFCKPEDCAQREIFLMEELRPPINLYRNKYCRTNYKVSYKTRQKIIIANTGRKNTEETKEKMRRSKEPTVYRYVNGIKTLRSTIIEIPIEILEQIKTGILQENYTIFKIYQVFGFSKAKIIKNLKLYFNNDTLLDILKNNKPKYCTFIKPSAKFRDPSMVEQVVQLYRNGSFIKDIAIVVNLHSDGISKIIKSNLSEEERKKIISNNKKR